MKKYIPIYIATLIILGLYFNNKREQSILHALMGRGRALTIGVQASCGVSDIYSGCDFRSLWSNGFNGALSSTEFFEMMIEDERFNVSIDFLGSPKSRNSNIWCISSGILTKETPDSEPVLFTIPGSGYPIAITHSTAAFSFQDDEFERFIDLIPTNRQILYP